MWRPRLEVRAAPEDGTGQGQGQGQGQEEDVRSCGKVTADGPARQEAVGRLQPPR